MPNQAKASVSLVPFLKGEKSINQPVLFRHYTHFSERDGGLNPAVKEGNWKSVQFYINSHFELYNPGFDMRERADLAKTFCRKTAELQDLLSAWKKENPAKFLSINPY